MESDERAQRKWCNALKLTEYDSFKGNSVLYKLYREKQESCDSLHSLPVSPFSSIPSSLVLFAVSEVMNVYVYLSFY